MSNILIVSEHENELIQLSSLSFIAKELKKDGHDIKFIIFDIINGYHLIAPYGFKVFQSPIPFLFHERHITPYSYCHLLTEHQYNIFDFLVYRIFAYQCYFRLFKPDIILFNNSFGAFIASMNLNVKRIFLGDGCRIPPHKSPIPCYKYSANNVSTMQLSYFEEQLIDCINKIFAKISVSKINNISNLFNYCTKIISTFPELDHCIRENEDYWGTKPFPTNSNGSEIGWQLSSCNKKVFIYLDTNTDITHLLKAVRKTGYSIHVFVSEMKFRYGRYNKDNVHISSDFKGIYQRIVEADLLVCNGAHDMVCLALQLGKPLLLLPEKFEQFITARNILKIGAGIMCNFNDTEAFVSNLDNALNISEMKEKAAEFAFKYKDFENEYFMRRFFEVINS